MIIGLLAISIISIYFCWLFYLAIVWISNNSKEAKFDVSVPVSIIIPCRNEEKNINACIESIYAQNYPKELIEVIVIDDHSEDSTIQCVIKYNKCKLIQLPSNLKGKKAALTEGINNASNELIITRDADTFSDVNWLRTIVNEQVNSDADMLIGPVTLKSESTLLNIFQRLEFYAFTIVTGATAFIKKPIMCNGANLCFKKSVFTKVDGYKGNDDLASGDDVFLMNKISALSQGKILYLKDLNATVYTSAENSLNGMTNQRLRWAGKNNRNPNLWNAFTGLSILLANVSWLFMGVLSVFYPELTIYFVIITTIKCIIDFLLLFLGSSFHKQGSALIVFPLFAVLYPIYIVLIAILSMVIKPKWKGRF